MSKAPPAPPFLPRPKGATWPDPEGGPHPCDRAAFDAVDRAEDALAARGDRLGCLQHLGHYEFLRRCGVERPDLESRVRGLFVKLGCLPHGHRVPETVASAAELLAVFSVNQDSPQKTFTVGGGWHYCDAPRGSREGSVRAELRFSALVNYGREKQYLREQPREGDITGSHVTWDAGEVGRTPADRYGQPKTAEHHRAMAELALRKWATILAFEERAGAYGWRLNAERDDIFGMVASLCEGTGLDPKQLPPPLPILDDPPARPKRTRRPKF